MMRQILFLLAVLVGMAACGNSSTKQKQESASTESSVKVENLPVYKLDELLQVASNLVDKRVKVIGYVNHTCKHSGKRCFLIGENEGTTFRVEAKGKIGGFNRELVGSELEVTGVVKERRLTKEYLDQYEKDLNEQKIEEDGSAESCQAELNNIEEMRNWMRANEKEYYSLYFMDGEEYEIIEE